MDEHTSHPLDYLSVLRRRRWWLIVPMVAALAAGAALAAFLPKTYLSEAEIGIAAPTLSPELLRGVSSLDKEERQRAISQQLLSRTVLERVVRDEQLQPGKPVEQTAAWLRSRVKVTVPQPIGRAVENKNGLDSFKLGYIDSSPAQTQRITNRLASVFVEENSRTQTQRAENTSEVLAQQLQGSQDRLTTLETQLRRKKEANMGRLPDQINANIQMVNGFRQQLDSYSVQLRAEQDRLSQLESQIDQMRQGSVAAPPPSATSAATHTVEARITQIQQELAQARAAGYTDKHPEIERLKSELKMAQTDLAVVKKPEPENREALLAADPIYRQRLADRDAARLRIRTLQAQSSNATGQIAQYQSRVEAAPMVEEDLSAVTREVELEKARYTDLKTKHENARLAEDLARKQGGERFSVLYPATLPSRPESPDLVRLMLMAAAIGLVLGVALAMGREFLDRSVHDVRALQSEFEIPVLGEIPRITRVA